MAGRHNRIDRLSRLKLFKYPKRKARPPSPRESANFLQAFFVSWLLPLLKVGMKREITEYDLYPTLFEDQSDHIGDHLEIMWGDHQEECKEKGKKPSLFRVLWKAYATKFFFFGLFSLAEEVVFRMVQLVAVGYVLDYFEGNYLTTFTGTVLFGVGGILVGAIVFLISFHWSSFHMHHVCCHIRIGLSSLVYRKMLHLSQSSLRNSTVGQIVTMIASDLHRFDRKHVQINYIWVAPIHLLVVVYILYFHYHYGVASLVGLSVLLFFTVIQFATTKMFMTMRQTRVDSSDFRIRAVVEIINSFYTIKLQCWEKFFQDKAMDNRKTEIKVLRTTMFLRLVNTALGFLVTKISLFMTFLVAFYLEDQTMDAKRVFVTLILYEHVRVNCMILFPAAINDIAELSCSYKRIEKYLVAEELALSNKTPELTSKILADKDGTEIEPKIEVRGLTCRWKKEDTFCLDDINFTAKKGQLFAIAGPVASGKSSLISAILGELPPEKGHILVIGRLAYVPQVPSIFPGSIRRNIVFGYGLNQDWYNEVIQMCELKKDFKTFPKGDQSLTETTKLTQVQRAKINIARALYANADVYILDDPLQSIDLKRHEHFLDTILRGALADKVVLLVTHQVQVLQESSEIILMYDGRVQKHGTFHEFQAEGIEFYHDTSEQGAFDDDGHAAIDVEFQGSELEVERDRFVLLVEDDLAEMTGNPKEMRNMANIQFDVDENNPGIIRRVTQGQAALDEQIKLSGVNQPTSALDETIRKVTINQMAIMAKDGEAYDAHDRIQQPKKIRFALYYDFLKTGSSGLALLFLLFICIVSQALYTTTDIWIEEWANDEGAEPTVHYQNAFYIYIALLASIAVTSFIRSLTIFKICMKASTAVFEKLLNATITARLFYFERTCAGHAINRLAKDMVIIDDLIPPTLLEALAVVSEIVGALFIMAYANPYFLIPSFIYVAANLIVYRIYHLTAVDLKRIEGNARTPVYAHLNKTLMGVTTIRAFGQEQAFAMIFDRLQDNHTSSWYLFLASQGWLAVTVDWISIILMGCITLSFFYMEKTIPAKVGMTISKLIELSILAQFAAAEMANVETQMISVERALEFANPKETGLFETFDGPEAPEGWPSNGDIELIDVPLTSTNVHRHRNKITNKLNVKINGGQWIGIVGKAGSGKTSMFNALFRIGEMDSGTVLIDGVNVKDLGLHNLRSRISMIPQTPCMYQGTLRQNIDPLNHSTDDQIWTALQESSLYDSVQKMDNGLDSSVTEFGMNFSFGQRQFVSLARAMLENNKILCCDEPTACLDPVSQMHTLQKLREHFGNTTLLIAIHRIQTIVDCDRILVLEKGTIVEDGTPLELLQKKSGPFYELITHIGSKHIDDLIAKVKQGRGHHHKV